MKTVKEVNGFKKEEMTTLTGCLNVLLKEGFTENFVVTEKGLKAPSSEKVYAPSQVSITNFYRFEGESDPADNAILYAIETNDGVKGTVVDAYGAYANQYTAKFMADVEEIFKQEHHKEAQEHPV